jgi:hypothetical protein
VAGFFLSQYNGITVMLDTLWSSNDSIELFTDSVGGRIKGFGIYFQGKWAQSCWPKHWIENGTLRDITFLELFPVVVSIYIWGSNLRNKKLVFRVDNESVVVILNKKSSKSIRVMSLVRVLVLSTLKYNIMIKAEHTPGKINKIAGSLSRSDWQLFRSLCQHGTEIPNHLLKF